MFFEGFTLANVPVPGARALADGLIQEVINEDGKDET